MTNIKTTIIDTTTLTFSEDEQDNAFVTELAKAMGADTDQIAWDEQPAIIIDEDGLIIDGHHRVAASLESSLNEWRAIVVDREHFDALEDRKGWQNAVMTVCDEANDDVTWGHVAN